jgi:hypothetical protein
MDKRLYAVVVVGVLFSGTADAADCDKLPTYTPESRNLREECERSKSIAEENRMRIKIACQQSKWKLAGHCGEVRLIHASKCSAPERPTTLSGEQNLDGEPS